MSSCATSRPAATPAGGVMGWACWRPRAWPAGWPRAPPCRRPRPSTAALPQRRHRRPARPCPPAVQAASSFTPLLRQQGDGRSFTSIRVNSASWRTAGHAGSPARRPAGSPPADGRQPLPDPPRRPGPRRTRTSPPGNGRSSRPGPRSRPGASPAPPAACPGCASRSRAAASPAAACGPAGHPPTGHRRIPAVARDQPLHSLQPRDQISVRRLQLHQPPGQPGVIRQKTGSLPVSLGQQG